MITEVKVGPQVNTNGSTIIGRGGRTGEIMVADTHARYQQGKRIINSGINRFEV